MRLKNRLDAKEFAVLAEIEPPKGADVSQMVENTSRVKGVVEAFIVPEMSNAVMRMSSLGGSMILQSKGMDVIMQVSCRDRNRLAIQADLLAANACGIQNLMVVTGEDPSFGDHHQAKAVYDIDILELLQGVKGLQKGRDMAGIELAGAPGFYLGATANAGAQGESLKKEIAEVDEKIENGVEFFIIPPVFDLESIEPFLKEMESREIKIIPTVLLLKSVGMARYMARNVKNVHIPDTMVKRIQKSGDKVRECVTIAREMVKTLQKEGFAGALIATLGWENKLPEIIGGMGV